MKRFIETSIWTQNKWFRKLKPKYKLFWIYIICNCDAVGVWEEDFELVSYIIGDDFTREEIDGIFAGKIKWFNEKKLWIIDFCNFQYGALIEKNTANKPHQSYINLLKKHSLWIDYCRGMKYPLDGAKDKDKDKDIDKEEEKRKRKPFKKPTIEEVRKYFHENGYKDEIAIKAFNSYDTANWFDSKGDPILNWKQKMINVWFRDEHKITKSGMVY